MNRWEMDVLCPNTGSCVSSTTRMRHDTLMNDLQRLTRKRRNGRIKSLFVFSLRTKSILVASETCGWTTGVPWAILTMSLLPSGPWMCQLRCYLYGASESSRISSKISSFVFWRCTKGCGIFLCELSLLNYCFSHSKVTILCCKTMAYFEAYLSN